MEAKYQSDWKRAYAWQYQSNIAIFCSFNGYLTRCKYVHAKNQQNHSTLSINIGNLLFQRILGIPDNTQLKRHNTVASKDVQTHAINKQNNSNLARDTGTLLFWRMLGMPDQTQQIHDLTKAYMDI